MGKTQSLVGFEKNKKQENISDKFQLSIVSYLFETFEIGIYLSIHFLILII